MSHIPKPQTVFCLPGRRIKKVIENCPEKIARGESEIEGHKPLAWVAASVKLPQIFQPCDGGLLFSLPCFGPSSLKMHDVQVGQVIYFEAMGTDATAPFDILGVHERSLIEHPCDGKDGSAHEEVGPCKPNPPPFPG